MLTLLFSAMLSAAPAPADPLPAVNIVAESERSTIRRKQDTNELRRRPKTQKPRAYEETESKRSGAHDK